MRLLHVVDDGRAQGDVGRSASLMRLADGLPWPQTTTAAFLKASMATRANLWLAWQMVSQGAGDQAIGPHAPKLSDYT